MRYLNDFYPIRKCTSPGLVKRANGCLFYQLGNCMGPCTGSVKPHEYKACLEKIRLLMEGEADEALAGLEARLRQAADRLEFEKAAKYREYFVGLKHVIGKQRLIKASDKRRNILVIEFIDNTYFKIFYIKGNKLLHSRKLSYDIPDTVEFGKELAKSICEIFASNGIPSGRLTQYDIDEAQIIYSYIKRNRNLLKAFWIPSSRLNGEKSKLDVLISKIEKAISMYHTTKDDIPAV